MGIKINNISKVIGDPPTQVLSHISFDVHDGEFISLTGRSGSGKSTLLYLLSSLDTASDGEVLIDHHDVHRMKRRELYLFRNEKMGFVFQFHYLIAELSALENVLLPARKTGREKERASYALELFRQFGLEGKIHRLPRQLSGGEQQRVAIARALVMEPRYLFADEPTGSLDTANGQLVMNIILEVHQRLGTTVILVTHDPDFARLAPRQIHLVDGKIA